MTDAGDDLSGQRIPSPCVRNCCLDEHDVCLGCGRTLEEIRLWGAGGDVLRREIVTRAAQRLQERKNRFVL